MYNLHLGSYFGASIGFFTSISISISTMTLILIFIL